MWFCVHGASGEVDPRVSEVCRRADGSLVRLSPEKGECGAEALQLVMRHWDAKTVASAKENVYVTPTRPHVWPVIDEIIVKVVDQI